MLRSLVKNVPVAPVQRTSNFEENETPAITAAANEAARVAGTDDKQSAPPHKKLARRAKSGGNLRDELVEIVREDPDMAANILKSWISNATPENISQRMLSALINSKEL